MKKTIAFVAGATGLTGRHVVKSLRTRGIHTIAHVRPNSTRLEEWRERFDALGAEVDATPWENEAMRARMAASQPTHVFALLGTTRARAKRVQKSGQDASEETYEHVDYGLTSMLRGACEHIKPTPRFAYLSSMGVSQTGGNAYLKARAKVERELHGGTLPYTIIQPSFIIGERDIKRPGESFGAVVFDSLLKGIGVFGAQKFRDQYRSIQAPDLAEQIVLKALDPTFENQTVQAYQLR